MLKAAEPEMNEKTVKFTFTPNPLVCSQFMNIELEGTKIRKLEVIGGCPGNIVGIGQLIEGMEVDEVIRRLDGISCGGKPTSCPDQLAKALKKFRQEGTKKK